MSKPLVSIICGAYNAQQTLERTVQSVAQVTYRPLEMIIVDDKSTDDTLALAEDLAKKYSDETLEIRVIPLEENQGPGGARNPGLESAQGEWLTIIDADDIVDPNGIAAMIAATDDDDRIDCVIASHEIISVNGEKSIRSADLGCGNYDGATVAAAVLEAKATPYVWDKLFRSSIAKKIRFADILRAEDSLYVFEHVMKSRRVRVIDQVAYHYFVSPTSMTWSKMTPIDECVRLMEAFRDLIERYANPHSFAVPYGVGTTLTFANAAHQSIINLETDEAVKACRNYARHIAWKQVLFTLRSSLFFGVAACGMKILPQLYCPIYRTYAKRRYDIGV